MTANTLLNTYTLSLMMAISLGFSITRTVGMESVKDEKPTIYTTTPHIFTSAKEALNYSASIFNLCNADKFEEALAMALPEPILDTETVSISGKNISTGFSIGDLGQYHFFRLCSLSMIYIQMGNKERLNPEKAIGHYQNSLKNIDIYLSSPVFGSSFVSQHPHVNNTANDHRALAYRKKSEASYNWACLLIRQEMCDFEKDLPKKLLLSSIDCLTKATNCLEISTLNEKDHLLLEAKFSLFNTHITLIPLCDEKEGGKFLKDAKIIHRAFQNGKNIFYKGKTSQSLKLLEANKERNLSLTKTSGTRKVQEIRQKKSDKQGAHLNEMIKDITTEPNDQNPLPLKVKVAQDHQHLFFLAQNNMQDPNIIPSLKAIEEEIQQQLIESKAPATLFHVYQQYEVFLGGDTLRKNITSHILPAFLHSGDMEGALEHIIILADLELKKFGYNSNMTLCLRAAIKNLNGDHEEWEAFEQKMTETWEHIKKEKEATKKQKEQEHAALIRNREILLPSKFNNKRKKEANSQKSVIQAREEKPDLSVDQENSFDHSVPSISLREEKEEKKKRHEEAEKQREAQENQLTSVILDEKKPEEIFSTTPQLFIQDTLPNIKNLYILTAVAKDVDTEIENNTWMFSRKDLMMYFEALGCTATDGGKHKKVSLPKAVFIFYEGSTIAIMNELGGALTLPRWDGSEGNGQVPSYLRKQILKAREKLVLLQLKANNTTNNTITNSK